MPNSGCTWTKAEEFDGINMRYFTNREAALHFLGKDEEMCASVH
jgi:hypothetical protein